MREVAIASVGMIPVGEHWESSLRMLAADAIQSAVKPINASHVDGIYVGNAYGAPFSSQSQLGALVADYAGYTGVEALTIEAGDASGGAALRAGYQAVASGSADVVIVVGVEKSTDSIGSARIQARSVSLDADFEAVQGATLPALAALIMRRYMYEYGIELSAFEGFSINAHRNGALNPLAMYRNALKPGAFAKAPLVSDPVNLFDGAPDGDGAAAVVLATPELAQDMTDHPVVITGSAAATDTFALQERQDMLYLNAVKLSVDRAIAQSGITLDAIDLFEAHDAYTILSALSLEAAGFAARGEGWKLAANSGQDLGLQGRLPVSTFGGLKARGNPVGATGVYQAAEAVLQLRGEAGDNQVANAEIAMIQSIGGFGSTVVTHILKRS